MQLFLDGAELPLASPAPHALVLAPAGARLCLRIPADEELLDASLTLHRHAGAGAPSFDPPVLATNLGGPGFAGIAWVTADWGGARSLRRIALTVASATRVRVRVQIARGSSGWFSPPGPHTFDLADGTNVTLNGSFPDTVADRVMLELLDQQSGQPTAVTLTAPPILEFGIHARDLAARVAGGRDAFTHAGELPPGAIAVDGLLDLLRARGPLTDTETDTEIDIELRAAVAGVAALTWRFDHTRVVRAFDGGRDRVHLSLPWDEPAVATIATIPGGRPTSLELALAGEPARERIAMAPAHLGEAVAELGRPLLDNAQPFSLPLAQPVAGVDLWARCLSPRLRLRVELRPDEAGRPASPSRPALTGTRVLDDPDAAAHAPGWLSVDLPAPMPVPAETWWLVVVVEEGELLWFLGGPRPAHAGAPRYRRNDGAWLDREATDPGAWALARLRVHDPAPPPPIEAALVLVTAGGDASEQPLVRGDGGVLRWHAAGDEAVARLDLRLRAAVASAVTLSNLHLRYRESP